MFLSRTQLTYATTLGRLSCAVLIACLATAAHLFAQPFHHQATAPSCADGSCLPNTYNFGYYQTRWRRWPTSPPPIVDAAAATGRTQAVPPPELPAPRYEGDPTPPVRSPIETPRETRPLPPPPELTPPALPPQSSDATLAPAAPLVQSGRKWADPGNGSSEYLLPPPPAVADIPAAPREEIRPASMTSPLRESIRPENDAAGVRLALPLPAAPPKPTNANKPNDKTNESTIVFRLHPIFQQPTSPAPQPNAPLSEQRLTP